MEKLTGFMRMGGEKDFFVAYPQGVNRHWNDGRELPSRREIDDVEFLVRLVDHLRQSFPVDAKRVYACGISNGGFFAQYLAARAPGIFAAVASVAAMVHEPMYKGVKPVEPVPIMFVVGKDDPVVPFCGGEIELASRNAGRVVSAEQSFEYWAVANHADLRYSERELPVLSEADPTRVFKRVYPAGENGKPVVACIVEGGGHAWPKGWQFYRERYIGKTSQQLDTSGAVVEFCFQNSRSD
jgi:polyhydroxybutyrate depolymerase